MSGPIHIISLGAGVQSSAMAIMACHGLIKPMPHCAIFADTGDEPAEVYAWLRELTRMLTFPVVWLTGPKLSDGIVNQWGHSQIPAWFLNDKGKPTIGRRQCTKYFKVLPVRHEIRRRYPKQKVTLWQGISVDEIIRMKESDVKWLTHRWPLIEQRLSRGDCVEYLKRETSWTVPKSACCYCPFRSKRQWRDSMKKPAEAELINRVDAVLNPRGEYLSSALAPMAELDLRGEAEHGQEDMFNNECSGSCGV